MHELRHYLEMLLAHQCGSSDSGCMECQRLQRIYGFLQTELFSTVIYSETPLSPRPPGRLQPQAVTRAAAGPRHPQTR